MPRKRRFAPSTSPMYVPVACSGVGRDVGNEQSKGESGLRAARALLTAKPERDKVPSAVVFVRQAAAAGARAAGDADSEEDEEGAEGRVSKRKRKLESRLKIAELKQSCPRPEVVEVWDVTAQDPRLLVYLKVRP